MTRTVLVSVLIAVIAIIAITAAIHPILPAIWIERLHVVGWALGLADVSGNRYFISNGRTLVHLWNGKLHCLLFTCPTNKGTTMRLSLTHMMPTITVNFARSVSLVVIHCGEVYGEDSEGNEVHPVFDTDEWCDMTL